MLAKSSCEACFLRQALRCLACNDFRPKPLAEVIAMLKQEITEKRLRTGGTASADAIG